MWPLIGPQPHVHRWFVGSLDRIIPWQNNWQCGKTSQFLITNKPVWSRRKMFAPCYQQKNTISVLHKLHLHNWKKLERIKGENQLTAVGSKWRLIRSSPLHHMNMCHTASHYPIRYCSTITIFLLILLLFFLQGFVYTDSFFPAAFFHPLYLFHLTLCPLLFIGSCACVCLSVLLCVYSN